MKNVVRPEPSPGMSPEDLSKARLEVFKDKRLMNLVVKLKAMGVDVHRELIDIKRNKDATIEDPV